MKVSKAYKDQLYTDLKWVKVKLDNLYESSRHYKGKSNLIRMEIAQLKEFKSRTIHRIKMAKMGRVVQ